ncbi:MAG: hypothetical protein ACLQBX_06890 [Candidatus Limnocylindrales bacterium]
MASVGRVIGLLAAAALILMMDGCGAVTNTPWPTTGPGPLSDRLGPGDAVANGIDGVQPGVPFSWGDLQLYDEASDPAVIDAVVLNSAPPDLRLVAAGALPQMLLSGGTIVNFPTVPSSTIDAVKARPLIGGDVEPASEAGWSEGASIVFVLQLPRVGDYTVSTFTLHYHVGPNHYTATYQDTLEVCVGAKVVPGPGHTCPYASPSPSAGSIFPVFGR